MSISTVILGVSGSISAYKAPEIIRVLRKKDITVKVLLTKNAEEFVAPYALEVVSENPVVKGGPMSGAHTSHVELCRDADAFVIVPASANVISKCAHGIADDFLTTAFLAFEGPRLIIPAMHTEMWLNPVTQRNVARLKEANVSCFGPISGDLASGDHGLGRLPDSDIIGRAIQLLRKPKLDLVGKRILVTAGGCKEAIDAVRFIGNRSSGKLGIAIAQTAAFFGADVTLLSSVETPVFPNILLKSFSNHADLSHLLSTYVGENDLLIMAAAVSDFHTEPMGSKLSRSQNLSLNLLSNSDLLKSVSSKEIKKIGFCLADENLEDTAISKLVAKDCEYIVANNSTQFAQDSRSIMVFNREKECVLNLENHDLLDVCYELLSVVAF